MYVRTGMNPIIPIMLNRLALLGFCLGLTVPVAAADIVPHRITEAAFGFDTALFYKPPQRGTATSRLSLGTRGGCPALPGLAADFRLQALAPPGATGLTLQTQPTLYWWQSAPGLPRTGQAQVQISLTRLPSSGKPGYPLPVAEHTRPLSWQAGIQGISLAEMAVQLSPAVDYEWSISLLCSESNPSANPTSVGYIRLAEASSAALAQQQTTPPPHLPHLYAAQGLWYDALDRLNQRPPRAVPPATWSAWRDSLLHQGGLGAVAAALSAP